MGATARERALGAWLHNGRQEASQGVLSPFYKQAMEAIPGWDTPSTRTAADEARWKRRLTEVADYLAGGNDRPRHNKTDIKNERVLRVWLQVQRIDHRAGGLDPRKKPN